MASSPSSGPEPSASYARMSQRNEEGERIEDQFEQIDHLVEASAGQYVVAESFADNGITAWRDDVVRPGFERLLAALRTGRYRVVLAWRTSRIARDPVKGAEFGQVMKRLGGKLIVADGTVYDFATAAGRAAWHDATGQSFADSDQKSELLREMHRRKRDALEYGGGRVTFGWTRRLEIKGRKIVSVWEVDPAEGELLREAARRIRRGESPSSICRDFAARGVHTHKDKLFTITSLSRMLRHPRMAGYRTVGGLADRRISGVCVNWPKILDDAEWRETVAALDAASKRRATGTRLKRVYAGYYRCADCNVTLRYADTGGNHKTPRWRHPIAGLDSGEPCGYPTSFSLAAEPADALMDRLVTAYLQARPWEHPEEAAEGEALRAERTTIESGLAGLAEAIVSNVMSPELAGQAERRYRTRLAEIETELARQARLSVIVDGDLAASQWASGELTERRRVLAAILDTVSVIPGRDLSVPDRLTVRWKAQQPPPLHAA